MIDDRKLLAIFTYAAYRAGQCGNNDPEGKPGHMRALRHFISGKGEFPQEFFEKGNPILAKALKDGARDYVYNWHLLAILGSNGLEESIGAEAAYMRALDCAVKFYRVNSVDVRGGTLQGTSIVTHRVREGTLQGTGIVTPPDRRLEILEGLEVARKGEVVSGHFGHTLETLPEDDTLREYLEANRLFGAELERLHTTQK